MIILLEFLISTKISLDLVLEMCATYGKGSKLAKVCLVSGINLLDQNIDK